MPQRKNKKVQPICTAKIIFKKVQKKNHPKSDFSTADNKKRREPNTSLLVALGSAFANDARAVHAYVARTTIHPC